MDRIRFGTNSSVDLVSSKTLPNAFAILFFANNTADGGVNQYTNNQSIILVQKNKNVPAKEEKSTLPLSPIPLHPHWHPTEKLPTHTPHPS